MRIFDENVAELKNKSPIAYSFLVRFLSFAKTHDECVFETFFLTRRGCDFVLIDIYSISQVFLKRYFINFSSVRNNVSSAYFEKFSELIINEIEDFIFLERLTKS